MYFIMLFFLLHLYILFYLYSQKDKRDQTNCIASRGLFFYSCGKKLRFCWSI